MRLSLIRMSSSVFANVSRLPPNNILGVALECRTDPFPEKIGIIKVNLFKL